MKVELIVIEDATGEVVKAIDVTHLGERGRERCERGLNINLDHARFRTDIRVSEPEQP